MQVQMYTVSQKNDTDVAHYNFNAHQPILVIFGRYAAELNTLSNGDLIFHHSYLMSLHYLWKHERRKLGLFSHTVPGKRHCVSLLYL